MFAPNLNILSVCFIRISVFLLCSSLRFPLDATYYLVFIPSSISVSLFSANDIHFCYLVICYNPLWGLYMESYY